MNSLAFSKILNLAFLVFIGITFWNGYEFLFVTRIALFVFALITFLIEGKKDVTPIRKLAFIRFGIISIFAVCISLFIDSLLNDIPYFSRQLLLPLYMLVILSLLYVELYGLKRLSNDPTK